MSRKAFDPRRRGTSAWITAVRERTFGNATEKLMMMVLCDYINANDVAWPGTGTLAADVGCDPRTIKRALARLEGAGVIRRVPRPNSVVEGRDRTDPGGKRTDAILFLWAGFQELPLVEYPDRPLGADDEDSGLGDILSTGSGDTAGGVRGQSGGVVRGHSDAPSSFRTPSLEPPKEPLTPTTPGVGLALVAPLPSQATEDSLRLCNLLADLIHANGSLRPNVTTRWLRECDRLMRLDKRTPDQIERAIRWCQSDPFWRANVLSMPTLREKYDRLKLEHQRQVEMRAGKAGPARMNKTDQRMLETMDWIKAKEGQ